MEAKRVVSLDYLRGIFALSVMIYHYVVWSGYDLSPGSLLSKLGIYAVSSFYVLSGLSLMIVYRERLVGANDIKNYFIKRFFRIAPLFWLSVLAVITLGFLSAWHNGNDYSVDEYKVFLNLSLLFGFIEPTAYMSTGAWSIGNEMVFYTIFPILVTLTALNRWSLMLACFFALFVAIYFAFVIMDPGVALSKQWSSYINPFNQLYLFVLGCVIAVFGSDSGRHAIICFFVTVISCSVFILMPLDGGRAGLISGVNRIVLSICCVSFIWAIYSSNVQIRGFYSRALGFLGEGGYSIYLMHPLVASVVVPVSGRLGFEKTLGYIFSVAVTLLFSYLTFNYLEKPCMKFGARLGKKPASAVV